MKLIIKQYLASLKERDELDALLPDLLSQMGLNVFSRPRRGTRQDGVDVAAVGRIDGSTEKVYLLSLKAGDLTRASWDGPSSQALRPSLNEILDAYIPSRLPHEHRGKPIVICLCFAGDVLEQVRPGVKGYIKENTREGLSFEEWNGDKLADLVLASFLREDLLPPESRPLLRKSLALLDEPEASFKHFSSLIERITRAQTTEERDLSRSVRQINICLWILFVWARDAANLEAAYLSAERAVLHGWELSKDYFGQESKFAENIQASFSSILYVYQLICNSYIADKIIPHAGKLHGLSTSVWSSSKLDVNLKLFDVLGRLAMAGIWSYWNTEINGTGPNVKLHRELTSAILRALKMLITNNPTLLLPFKDGHAIDIFLASLFLTLNGGNEDDIKEWLNEMIARALLAFQCHGPYPCVLRTYRDLLEHPKRGDDEYRKDATSGSILYPTIALWAALLKDCALFDKVKAAKKDQFGHCNFQLWYPDETSEDHFYTNNDLHGAVLSDVPVNLSPKAFLEVLWNECDATKHFENLSAVRYGLWPLILLACRHYRLPVPLHFTVGYREALRNETEGEGNEDV